MGTLEKFRRTSPYLLAAFAILFVGFMVASDADIRNLMHSGTNYQTAILAKVNGEPIYYKDYENKVKDQIEQRRAQLQNSEQDIDEKSIRKNVWDQMINDILLKQAADKMGILVPNDEILDVMFDNPPESLKKAFTDSSGNFQRETYLELITNPDVLYDRLKQRGNMSETEISDVVTKWKSDLINIEKDLIKQKLNESLNMAVNQAGSVLSNSFLERKYIDEKSTADVSFLMVGTRNISDSAVKVSDAEIQAYYDKIKTYYVEKPKRLLKYVTFPEIPSNKDSALANKNIKKIQDDLVQAATIEQKYNVFTQRMRDTRSVVHDFSSIVDLDQTITPYFTSLNEKDVIGPIALRDGVHFFRLDGKREGVNEQVKASHILINFGKNKDSAKAEAMKIFIMSKNGEDFASLARKYSSDGSAQKGGDLGWFGKGKMVKPFEDAAFSTPVGQITGPVESQFGFHIIKVMDKQKLEIKYSEIIITPIMSTNTQKDLKRDANEIKKLVESGMIIDSAAKKFNQTARETGFIEKNREALGSNSLTAKAFAGKVNEVIEPMELKGTGIVVAQITGERKAGYVQLEDLKPMIMRKLLNSKKLDMVKNDAENLYSSVKNLDSLNRFSGFDTNKIIKKFIPGIHNNGSVVGLGQDYIFTTKAITLPVGKISELIRGDMGYYIMQVTSQTIADPKQNQQETADYNKDLLNRYKQSSYYQWYQKIKEDANIEDFRNEIFRSDY